MRDFLATAVVVLVAAAIAYFANPENRCVPVTIAAVMKMAACEVGAAYQCDEGVPFCSEVRRVP